MLRSKGLVRASTIAWAVVAFIGACDVPVDRPVDGPRVLSTYPLDQAEDVRRRLRVVITFDRPLSPNSVDASTVRLVSGPSSFALIRRVDPVTRTLTLTPSSSAPLQPELRYRVVVDGVRDLEGRLAERLEISFRTGTDQTALPVITPPSFAQIAPIFEAHCARASCHGGDTPVLGLDLSSAASVEATAVGRAARETGEPSLPGARLPGLAGMRRIDASPGLGFPERSYLVYKIIGDPHVIGEPMPPATDAGAAPVSMSQAQLIADWIRAGAPTE